MNTNKNRTYPIKIESTTEIAVSCLGALLRLMVNMAKTVGTLALIYLAIKWLIQNT